MNEDAPTEKMRVCPSCRMNISVLATKCRFCGEEVGKPKDETRTLSIHDLGGEHVYHRAPSGSVMEALEAFRVDETLQRGGVDELDKIDFGLNTSGKGGGSGNAPSAFDVDYRPPSTAKKKPVNRGGPIAAILAGIVVLVMAVTAGPRVIDRLRGADGPQQVETYVNRAPRILERGGPAIDALEAAVEAIGRESSPENVRIAEDAVAALEKEVTRLLNESPFALSNLDRASSLATRGVDLYPNEVTRRLMEESAEDNRAYKMVLLGIDRPTDTATFRLIGPGSPEVKVQEKGELAGRFIVRSIVGSNSVTLTDTKRSNRPVKYEPGREPVSVR